MNGNMMVLPSKRMVDSLSKRAQDGFFTDTATVNYRTVASLDSYGQPTYNTTSTEVSCSFTDKPSKEAWATYADIESIEAEIRFTGTKPSKGDTIKLSERFNRASDGSTDDSQYYTEQTFEIIAIRDRDAFGYVCALKKVQI
jgi:hypothetical protein